MRMFKTKFCLLPVRLARHIKDAPDDKPNMEFIGWVWLQRAHLTRNLNHGWAAFLDSTPIVLHCDKCGQVLP